ncbi:MAG: hypothetical protein J7K40_10095 [candidate division Zixibacteria bacterium]|nr:hypothetical protein [candidate division Zixibacteria bacterium]
MFKQKLKELLRKSKQNLVANRAKPPSANTRIKNFELRLPTANGYTRQDRLSLYRFLAENIPILNGAIWLWTRLCAAPVEFKFSSLSESSGQAMIAGLDRVLSPYAYQKSGGIETIINMFFRSLFMDGCFGGEIILDHQGKSISEFIPSDNRMLSFEQENDSWQIYCECDDRRVKVEPGSFYFTGLDSTLHDPRGVSMLSTIGFISHLEQKLINDMSQNLERSGYQRIQVQLNRPERLAGESESSYIERANSYFDSTVDMMKNLRPSDSAVTWDDVNISSVGPSGTGGASSWYLYHRALVEDICAGVHLDPFMLGFSFGTTQTWARFKFELMMRQIISVQEKAKGFLRWLVGLEMALRGLPGDVEILFDNRRVFGSLERFKAESFMIESIISQYKTGLLDKQEARDRLGKIEPGII